MPEVLTLLSMADAEPDLSTFENKTGLAEDMKFLASMPELCDVTFLVGDTREPVCAVKVGYLMNSIDFSLCIIIINYVNETPNGLLFESINCKFSVMIPQTFLELSYLRKW